MPLNSGLHAVLDQFLHQIWAHDILSEPLLLEQLEMTQGRTGICQVLEIWWPCPVLQIRQVRDKGGLRQQFLGREVVQVVGVCERLDKLQS